MATCRLDVLVVERGLAETRARAQSIILGGGVSVDGSVITKPATRVPVDSTVALLREPLPYVSRGGLKLEKALRVFEIEARGAVALDVGASTGGFTDVLLQAGAKRVYALDVGYGQLAWKLRKDERVVVMERTNIRHVRSLPEPVDLAVVDVSFISLRIVLPAVRRLLRPDGDVICLIKPQFEAGREQVGKGGVVRDPALRRSAVRGVLEAAIAAGWRLAGLTASPILGPKGNAEFLAHLTLSTAQPGIDVEAALDHAFESPPIPPDSEPEQE
ncbi:MAG TPA: TlyA family RNA methyltransferase [Chloroflexota bacterium]|nr:TlyA family RNA methyltransferase [Chloroflexota bacterium]